MKTSMTAVLPEAAHELHSTGRRLARVSVRRTGLHASLCLAPFVLLGACTVMPTGPTVMVLPGSGKSFDQFRTDDFSCRNYAQLQVGNSAQQANVDSGVRSAALGTVIGAIAGAAMDGGHGAGVGAGTGLAFGTLAGVGAGQGSGGSVQQRYDVAYMQCMYSYGNRIPVAGRMTNEAPPNAVAAPPGTPPPPDADQRTVPFSPGAAPSAGPGDPAPSR
jgi:hypothetical protein